MSACPECGSDDSSKIETHPTLRECNECGHPRDATTKEIRADLIALDYDPDALAERIRSYVATLQS